MSVWRLVPDMSSAYPTLVVPEGGKATFGRVDASLRAADEQHQVISSKKLSKQHCAVEVRGGLAILTVYSTNGTYVASSGRVDERINVRGASRSLSAGCTLSFPLDSSDLGLPVYTLES